MVPLITLLVTFTVASYLLRDKAELSRAGRIALAAMLVVTGVAHFTKTEELAAMIPAVLPAPTAIVYFTGGLELAFAALLLLRGHVVLGWVLAGFFLAVLPANVHSALNDTGLGANGAAYLWFRVPLQFFFIAWAFACNGVPRRNPFTSRRKQMKKPTHVHPVSGHEDGAVPASRHRAASVSWELRGSRRAEPENELPGSCRPQGTASYSQ